MPFRWTLGLAFIQKQAPAQAVHELEQAVEVTGRAPYFLGTLGHIYGAVGRSDDAVKIVRELEEVSKQRHVSPYWNGMIYSALCDKNLAFLWLERARLEHAPWMAYIKAPPWFDHLRSDSRYYDLLRRMNIPI